MAQDLKLFSLDCSKNIFTENYISESGNAVKSFAIDKDFIYISGLNINYTTRHIAKYNREYPHELIHSVDVLYNQYGAACVDDLYLYLLLIDGGHSIEKRKKSDLSVVIEPVYVGEGNSGQCLCILKNKLFYIGYNYDTNSSKIIMFDTEINFLDEYILPEDNYARNLISDNDYIYAYVSGDKGEYWLFKLNSNLNIIAQGRAEHYVHSIAAGKEYIYGVNAILSYDEKKIWVHRFSKETLSYIDLFGEYDYSFDFVAGGYFGAEAVIL